MRVKERIKGVLTWPNGRVHEWSQDDLVDIVCNKCGQSCVKHDRSRYAANVYYCGGFESIPAIGDSVNYAFDLCETCLVALMDTFKHSALVDEDETANG